MRSQCSATKRSPYSPHLEKARMYNEDTVHPKVIKQINYLKCLKKKRDKRNREGWLS